MESPGQDRDPPLHRRRLVDRVMAVGRRHLAPRKDDSAPPPPPSRPEAPREDPAPSQQPPTPTRVRGPSVDELKAEVRYRRDRLALYRRRVLTGKPSSPVRLRELERAAASARDRLGRAIKRRDST